MMAVIGGALLAVPIVLTMQFLATSTRPSFGFGVAAMGSLPPESLATILFGNVFGSLRSTYDYWGPDWHSLAEGTWTDRATNYLFVGTIPALLLFWHGIAGGRLLAREFRFFLVIGIAAILYALGRYTPGFEMIFDHLPGVDLYRRPADATFLINIILAFAAGYLVHRYVRDGLPRFDAAAMGRFRVFLPMLSVGPRDRRHRQRHGVRAPGRPERRLHAGNRRGASRRHRHHAAVEPGGRHRAPAPCGRHRGRLR